jgi:membrane-bound lytic murein transglycosylase
MQGLLMKYLSIVTVAILLTACAVKPPVQEMAEARSAIKSAQQLDATNPKAKQALKSAEASMKEAADAIDMEYYDKARRKAIEAKRKAQRAARIQQSTPR